MTARKRWITADAIWENLLDRADFPLCVAVNLSCDPVLHAIGHDSRGGVASVELFYSRSAPNQDLEGQSYLLVRTMRRATDESSDSVLASRQARDLAADIHGEHGTPRTRLTPVRVHGERVDAVMSESSGGWGAVLRTTVLPEVRLAGSGYDLAAIEFDAVPPGGWAEVIPR